MRVVLTIASGPDAGHKLWLEPGQVAEVGSGDFVDLVVHGDEQISRRHFQLNSVGGGCQLINLCGVRGTCVNGSQRASIRLADGDEVVAGQTRFTVAIDGVVGSGLAAAAAPISPSEAKEQLLQLLSGTSEPLFALLDAARDPMVLALLLQSNCQFESLYEGTQGAALAVVAPYLVQLSPGCGLLPGLVQRGWGASWGVYLTARQSFPELRRHFRRFLMVATEDGAEMYFRFYDPRVLRLFLPTCLPDEARQFFGPANAFYVENDRAGQLLKFPVERLGASEVVQLSAAAVAAGGQGEQVGR